MCELAGHRLLPVISTEDAWTALRGHFRLDDQLKVRVHKVIRNALIMGMPFIISWLPFMQHEAERS